MRTRFVAEVSSNHNADLERSKAFILEAARIGCDAVKFQLFKIDELFAPEILKISKTHRDRRAWELPLAFIPELSRLARSKGLLFSCTPFYLEAVDQLMPYVDFYKIASYELLWLDLFKKCAATGKPLVFSTGMATLEEITRAMDAVKGLKTTEVTVMHCVSAYPTPVQQVNLGAIDQMRSYLSPLAVGLKLNVGYSDHTVSAGVVLGAVLRHQASMIEFHMDIDSKGNEFGPGHCWLPNDIERVIRLVREAESVEGTGIKKPADSEKVERDWRADPSDGLRPLKPLRQTWRPS